MSATSQSATAVQTSPLKAYVAEFPGDEMNSVIVFGHRNSMALRREAAGRTPHGEVEACESLKRAPAFDHFQSADNITAKDYIERGWWFGCGGCERHVSEEIGDLGCQETDEEGSDELWRDEHGAVLEPTYHPDYPNSVWCSTTCRDADIAEREARRKSKRDLRAAARRRWPGIVIEDCWTNGGGVFLYFKFPGQPKGHRSFYSSTHELRMSEESAVAWSEFITSLRDRDPGDEHPEGGCK